MAKTFRVPAENLDSLQRRIADLKYHRYHLAGADGRKYLLVSKSKKKALVPGYEAVVEYAADEVRDHDERPVALVR